MKNVIFAATLVFISLATSAALAGEASRSIIILDGSGSMWGRIDGQPKLEIARQTIADILRDFPRDRALGLMAYGHRRRGDCQDIELLVEPETASAPRVLEAVNAMRFQGKTPLTQSVRQAAQALLYTEEPATVVLVTDGLETCSNDPCALANELEAAGIDFTAHVVGFGLSQQEGASIQCLADNTGGRYFDAANSADLHKALTETVVQQTVQPESRTEPATTLPALPPASLDAPPKAGRAGQINVTWSGPGGKDDYVDIVSFDGKGAHSLDFAPVSEGGGVLLKMPAETGQYVLRYRWKKGKKEYTLATRPIEVGDVGVFMEAPESAMQGSVITVGWGGPGGADDYVSLTPEGEDLIDAWVAAASVSEGNPTPLHVPLTPGQYNLRYIARGASDWDILLEKPFTVVPYSISLSAPQSVTAGERFKVDWQGPAAHRDWIDIVPAGETETGNELDSFYAEHGLEDDDAYTLLAPDTPGRYDIRYVATHPGRGEQVRILHIITIEVR